MNEHAVVIVGADNQSAIATLVERSTRYVMLVHLPAGRTAEHVRDGLVATMATLPAPSRPRAHRTAPRRRGSRARS